MTNENIFPHPVGDAIQKGACLLGLVLGAFLCWAAVYSFDTYRTDIDHVTLWCSKSNACTAIPTLFGSSVLRVFDDRQPHAFAMLGQLSSSTRTPIWARVDPFTLETVPTRQPKTQEASKSAKRKVK